MEVGTESGRARTSYARNVGKTNKNNGRSSLETALCLGMLIILSSSREFLVNEKSNTVGAHLHIGLHLYS